MRHAAKIKVTATLVASALNFPEGTRISGTAEYSWDDDTFVFYVEHPDLPEVFEGASVPFVNPKVSVEYKVDWGLNDIPD